MHELAEIDVRILQELLVDGRKSFSCIAKEVHSSKDIIWKHYKELKKAGVIVGATTQTDCRKLGYSGVATISISTETQNLAKTFEHLIKMPELGVFRYYNATNTLTVITHLHKLSDLQQIKESINRQNKINEIRTHLWLDVRNIPQNILGVKAEKNNSKTKFPAETDETIKIDATDLKIIEKLTQNGRTPFSSIAKELDLSTNTVVRRYEKLVENNFLKVCIQINPLKLGYQAILELNLALSNQNETKEIAEKLSRIPGVSYIVKLGGIYDLMVVTLVKDCNDIIRINDEVIKIPDIKKIDALMRQIPAVWPSPNQYISTF